MTPRARRLMTVALVLGAATLVAASVATFRRAHTPWRVLVLPEDTRYARFVAGHGLAVLTMESPTGEAWHVFSLESGQEVRRRVFPAGDWVHSFVPRSGKAVHGPIGGAVDLEDLVTGEHRRLLETGCPEMGVTVASNEELVASVTSERHDVGLARTTSSGWTERASLPGNESDRTIYWKLVFSPGASWLAAELHTPEGQDAVRVWSMADPTVTRLLPADRLLAIRDDGSVVLERTLTPDALAHAPGPAGWYRPATFPPTTAPSSAPGTTPATTTPATTATPAFGGEDSIVLVPREGPEVLLAAGVGLRAAVSANGETLATWDGDSKAPAVVVRSLVTGRIARRIARRPGSPPDELELSAEGDLLLVRAPSHGEVWDVAP